MTDTTLYDSVFTIPDMAFIAGTDKVLSFTAYKEDGVNLLNLSGGSVTWLLCPYGDFTQSVLEISGYIATANTFTVTISAASTLSLSGKYIQQIVITDFYGYTFRPGQGVVVITPAIPVT